MPSAIAADSITQCKAGFVDGGIIGYLDREGYHSRQ